MAIKFPYRGPALALATAAALSASVTLAPAPARAQSDTLKVGVATLPPSRGMPHSHAGAITNYTYAAIFDVLSRADEKGDMVPSLATSWRSTSTTVWHFTLRPNVTFSNGEPVTAANVAEALHWYVTSDEGKATIVGRSLSRIAKGARAANPTIVEIETILPDPAVAAVIFSAPVFEPKAFKERGMDGFGARPVGTGPYQVTRWNPEGVELEARADSWRAPKMKKMTITPLPEMTSRVQALLSGQIDLAPAVSIDSVKQIEGAGLKADLYPAPYALAWAFLSTYRDTPFKDVRVRQAANIAIYRDAIIKNLLLGKSVPASQLATTLTFGYNPNIKPYPYDPAGAKKLLAEAGYPNGFEMDAIVLPGNFPADADIYQAAAQDLGQVGIKVNLKPQTFAEYLKVLTAPGDPKDYAKAWGEKVYAYQQDHSVDVVPDASFRLINPWGCRRPVPFWCDRDFDAGLTKAQEEFDVEKRRKLLQDLMVKFHEQAPGLSLVQVVDVVGRSAKVENAKLIFRVMNYHEITKAN
jgi:peptide/nickel transport system substrate-binding protein